MPNFSRDQDHDIEDDLDIAARVMETVQRQIASYHEALQTVRTMRKELAARQLHPKTPENPKRRINTPALFAELLEEHGVPQPLSKAMAAEDFQDASFQTDAAISAIRRYKMCSGELIGPRPSLGSGHRPSELKTDRHLIGAAQII